ncbi:MULTISPECIES: LysR family transcriptional regulator [Afifella]|uniref:LysR family transcriptional regulator n=1 Tax=Afifella TaxID=643217 RepID=UPI000FE39C85|nr:MULTISPECIES: LysR family transcriptional regulator [Afifella]MCT8267729.1 LysR substrate-binding domain-containing protein [Afifella sp. JA880]
MARVSPVRTPNVRQIRAFLAVAKHLRFTRAAEDLNISQPALTVQINQLEEVLSIKLFDRNKRQVSLTPAGRNLLPMFERIVTDLEDVVIASTDLAYARRGAVRVAALPSVSASLLPKALVSFRRTHPNISVRIRDVVADDIINMVKAEQVDFGIGIRLTPDRDIKVENFITDHICAFFRRGHPIEDAPPVLTIKDCAPYPLILTSRTSSVRVLFERALAREGVEVHIAGDVNYMSTALGMVRAGYGIGILPTSAVDSGHTMGLGFKRIDAPWLNRRVGIIRKSGRYLSPVVEHFIQAVQDTAGNLPSANFRSVRRSEPIAAVERKVS